MTARLLLAASLLLATPLAFAQGGPGPQGNDGPPPMHKPFMDHDRGPGFGRGDDNRGMWWKNPELVTRIGLTPDQQKKIDDLFLQSRVQLIHMHASLEEEQLLLEPILNANPVDEPKAVAQIDKIADTRASLEKENAKMLLHIRGVLTPDQWTKLQASRDAMHHHDRGPKDDSKNGPGGDRRFNRGPRPTGPQPATAPSTPPSE